MVVAGLSARAQRPTPEVHGLTGTYYRGVYFGEKALTRTDAVIAFNWEGTSPAPELPRENYSVRWTGFLQAPKTGTYTLVVTADDGMRIWLGNGIVLDEWRPQPPTTFRVQVKLTAGQVYPLRVDYFQLGYQSRAQLSWIPPDAPKPKNVSTLFGLVDAPPRPTPIPASVLFVKRPEPPVERVATASVPLAVRAPTAVRPPAPQPVAVPVPVAAPLTKPVAVRAPVTSAARRPTLRPARRVAAVPRTVPVRVMPVRVAPVRSRPAPIRPRPAVAARLRPSVAPPAPPVVAPAPVVTPAKPFSTLARGTTLAIPNLYFEQGKPRLQLNSADVLDDLVAALKAQPALQIEIGGHTDNLGDAILNQRLSQERALRVRDYLVERGIAPARLTAVGYGGTRPIADNTDAGQRPRNRRVEVTVR